VSPKFDSQGNELALKYFRSTHREDQHKVRVFGDLAGDILQVKEIVPVED